MRQEELFGWQITNGGLRNLRKKVENWKKKKIEGCKLPYGIYAFKFGSLPNWCDDDWLDWGLFLFFLSSHSFKNVRRNVYPYFLIETTQVLCAPHYVNSPTFAQIYFQFLSHRHVKTRE
jgi:hypothetical protein